ncbi:MAG: class I SAM-dependent methyltransferase [Gammaproteobacteria bacterium]|nr:class I SAM-dependent methyltransferase [Gammaproteobacteria bacterium]
MVNTTRIIHRLCLCITLIGVDAAAATGPYQVPPDTPQFIRDAVTARDRANEHRARDSERHPAEVLALSGVKPGDRVIELAAYGQYYSTLLSELLGRKGRLEMFDLPYTEPFGGELGRAFEAAHDNTRYHQVDYNDADFPTRVDVVFNVLTYHDLQAHGVDTALLNRKVFRALKRGGAYVVIDHMAEDGSGWRDAARLHRIGVETIIAEVLDAGFELAARSELLAHPEDDRMQLVFTPSIRGGTARAVLIFRKPANR